MRPSRAAGQEIATLGPGDWAGEIALISDTPRTASVDARTPVVVLVITRGAFPRCCATTPTIAQKVLGERRGAPGGGRRLTQLASSTTIAVSPTTTMTRPQRRAGGSRRP